MKLIATALCALSVCSATVFAKFPSDLPQCHPGDSACLPEIITRIVQGHPKGHAGLAIPPFEPLRINAIDIVQGDNSPIAINLKLRDLDMSGLSSSVFTKVTGFTANPVEGDYELYLTIPRVQLTGKYKINGKVLVLPIQGDGKAVLTLDDLKIEIKYKPRLVTKNGRNYIQSDKFKLHFTTSRFGLNFSNLFNGNKELGDNMNVFLNENWSDILGELQPSIELAFEQIFEIIVNRIFAKVPYEDLFLQ